MKKLFKKIFCCALTACLLLSFSVGVFAFSAPERTVTKDGVNYILGDDDEHYEVLGVAFDLSTVKIASTVGGIPVTVIRESAFQNNEYINKVTMPSSIRIIGKSAFESCQNLTEVTLSKNIKSLPFRCFYDCGMLSEITLPSGLESIDDYCFDGCTMLGKLKIPASVKEIGHDAFLHCEQLTLDVSENDYAANYAKKENLNTDFKNSSAYFFLIVGLCVAAAAVVFFLISIPMKRHIKKHPTHDPVIYIDKFFSAIGKFFSFIYEKVKSGVIFAVSKIISFFEALGKRIKEKRAAKGSSSEEKTNAENDKSAS